MAGDPQGLLPPPDHAEALLQSARAQFEVARAALENARLQLSYCGLTAPTSGTMVSVPVNVHERVEAGQVVATLITDEKPITSGAARRAPPEAAQKPRIEPAVARVSQSEERSDVFDPKLAARYGISEDDLMLFGFDAVAQLGKALVVLSAEKGGAGRTLVSLTENYRCEMEFQDIRPPYLIVKGRLLGAQPDKPLLENTLYLEKDKPSLLGLTNLRQALILVLRLHDTTSAGGEKTPEPPKRGPDIAPRPMR